MRAEGSDGHILIPGFYDRVVPPSAKEREAWARLPFDEKEYTEKEMGARELVGEPEVPLFERVWARPTVEVHGIRGGFTGEGAKTVIPARAVAKISTRLVADQRVEEAVEQTKAAVKAACPKGVTAELKVLSAGAPSLTNPDNPFIHAAAEAMKQIFGKETVYIRSGGSIPIVGVFDRYLGIPSVMMGFGLPDDNLHAPNEKFHLPNFFRGIEAMARYLEILGGYWRYAGGAAQHRIAGADVRLGPPGCRDSEFLPFRKPLGPAWAHLREDGRQQAAGDQELAVPASGRAGTGVRDRPRLHARAYARRGRLGIGSRPFT